MSFNIQDFCCTCLSTSNEKCSEDPSEHLDNLSPFDKIKTVFLGLPAVMDSDYRICKKCCDLIDRTYEFRKTSLKNINVLNSYKNKLINQCDFLAFLNEFKEVKIEPANLCNDSFGSEGHSNGDVEVKEQLDMSYEEESEISQLYPEVKMEIGEIDLKKDWTSGVEKSSDFENISVELPEEVSIKEEKLGDPLLDDVGGELPEQREHFEPIGENSSMPLQGKSIHEDGKELDCAEGDESASYESELDGDTLIHSKGQIHTEGKSHKCDVCGKLFTRKHSLKTHMLTHIGVKPHKCDICGKTFNRTGNLKLHMVVHTSERPYKCGICGNLFNRKQTLKTHMLIHTGEKPYKCDICGNAFIQKSDLKRHMKIHTGEKSHKCLICGRLFTFKTGLETHMLIHTGEKRHSCDICGKFFTQRVTLSNHMVTHTGEKSHKCDICEKLFTLKSSLDKHKLIHTGEKPHKCNKCEKCFTRSNALKRHLLTHTDL